MISEQVHKVHIIRKSVKDYILIRICTMCTKCTGVYKEWRQVHLGSHSTKLSIVDFLRRGFTGKCTYVHLTDLDHTYGSYSEALTSLHVLLITVVMALIFFALLVLVEGVV